MTRSLLRRLAERPFTERERQRAFSLAALALLLAAALLTVTAGRDERVPTKPRTSTAIASPLPSDLADANPPTTTRAPARPGARTPTAVTVLARRFLSDFLPYLYGHRRARGIEGASRSLHRRLAADRPRVPATARRRRARIVAFESTRIPGRSATWAVRARVADGKVVDVPVELLIARRSRRLVVVQIGSE